MNIMRLQTMMPADLRRTVVRSGSMMLLLATVCPSAALSQQPGGRSSSAVVRSGPTPGVRLLSGRTMCDEELYEGHWVNRYWTTTGQIKAENQLGHRSRQIV